MFYVKLNEYDMEKKREKEKKEEKIKKNKLNNNIIGSISILIICICFIFNENCFFIFFVIRTGFISV